MLFVFISELNKSGLFGPLMTECMSLFDLVWLRHRGAIMTCSFLSSLVASLAQCKGRDPRGLEIQLR